MVQSIRDLRDLCLFIFDVTDVPRETLANLEAEGYDADYTASNIHHGYVELYTLKAPKKIGSLATLEY